MSHHYSGPDFGFPHGDARLDLADLYAFPKPGNAGTSVLIMNVHPGVGINRRAVPPSTPLRPKPFTNSKSTQRARHSTGGMVRSPAAPQV